MSFENASNYGEQGGARQVIGGSLDVVSGGDLDIESGAAFKIAGTDVTAVLAAAIAGVAAGYKVARGEVTLDGSNPTPIVTGLATVVGFICLRKGTAAPGLDPHQVSCDYGGAVTAGSVNLYAWKPTGAGDCTMIASTNSSAVYSWIAIGT